MEITAWFAPISPSYLICVVVGPLSHHLVWVNGDWDGSFYLVAFSGFLLHTLLTLLLPLLVPVTTFSTYACTLSSTHYTLLRLESLYILSTLVSIVVYRVFFHPLTRAGFPGPLLSRVTIFHRVFLTLRAKHRHALVLQRLHAQYKSDIVRVGPNHLSILSASSIDVIHGTNSRCTKGVAYENPMGECVNWDRDPKSHAERRRVWDRALGKEAREKYYERIQELTGLLMMRLGEASPQIDISKHAQLPSSKAVEVNPQATRPPISVNTHIHRFAFDVMAALCFSLPHGYQQLHNNTTHPMVPVIQTYMLVGVYAIMVPWLHCTVSRLWVPDWLVQKWDWMFFAFARGEVEKRRVQDRVMRKQAAVVGRKGEVKEDIMAYLVSSARGSRRELTNEELITDTLIMTVGGSDTTNSALVHALYRMAKHQDIQQKIHDEVTYVCPPDEKISIAHLNELHYLSALINEVLRLHPPAASGLPRVIPPRGLTVNGQFIPGGTNVITPTYALQRDERYFTAAEKFIPERWTSQKYLVKDARAFCPFGVGVYGCPGKQLAMMEMKLVLASVVRQLSIKVPEGVSEQELESRVAGEWRDCLTTQQAEIELVFETR